MAALRTFFRIADEWELTSVQQMIVLGCDQTTMDLWRAGRVTKGLEHETQLRLSHAFGIYSALQLLLPIRQRANAWIRQPNAAPLFCGKSALDRMLEGHVSDLLTVRQYLETACTS